MISRIERLVSTPFVSAFELQRESTQSLAHYGDTPLGQRSLLARCLLETGVNFVETEHDGWDTRANNQRRTRELCAALCQAMAALLHTREFPSRLILPVIPAC